MPLRVYSRTINVPGAAGVPSETDEGGLTYDSSATRRRLLVRNNNRWVQLSTGDDAASAANERVGAGPHQSHFDIFMRDLADGSTAPSAAGQVRFSLFTANRDFPFSWITYGTRATAAAGGTLRRYGLYTVASDGALQIVARTASDTTRLAAANTWYPRQLDTTGGYPASYTLQMGLVYAVAQLCVGTTTQPAICSRSVGAGMIAGGFPSTASGTPSVSNVHDRWIHGYLNGQTDLPTTVASGALTGLDSGNLYACLSA